ncbi:MAG TPA: 3-dehydroquinate synthase, partial [bacterium]|nr:3-dehydroquinate synthase [bacterium]
TRVAALYGERLIHLFADAGRPLPLLQVPEGEASKSLHQCELLYRALIERRCTRSTIILAFGGGVVGDLAGFIAATFLRGVRLVQIPTTLLAQVDSSVGGKTGVNHPLGKNLIGAFHQPELVCIDPLLLATLERRERLAGMGEVVKYALIRDRGFFTLLSLNLEALLDLTYPDLAEKVIETCCTIKAEIVSEDERERGNRALLNFGHTIGHGLEAAGGYRQLRHGEAVTRGMAAAVWLSLQMGRLTKPEARAAWRLLSRLAPPSTARISIPKVLSFMEHDKKQEGGGQSWILLEEIGQACIARDLPATLIPDAVRFACNEVWHQERVRS